MINKEVEGQKPFISVIIDAHDRKEFLKDAIESAINQSIDRSIYEIIVVKNFDDPEIDNLIAANQVISVKSSKNSLVGEDLSKGLEISRGEIISFLDDDDKFQVNKLETIFNIFQKDKEIVYYHNSQQFESVNRYMGPTYKTIKQIYDTKFLKRSLKHLISKYTTIPLVFNISSISVRKAHYIKYAEALKKLANHTDDFFFFLGLNLDGKYFFDDLPLTIYLRHDSASKAIHKLDSKVDYFERKHDIHLRGSIATDYILSLVNDSKLKNLLKAHKQFEFFSSKIYNQDMDMKLFIQCVINSRYYGLKNTMVEFYLLLKDIVKA